MAYKIDPDERSIFERIGGHPTIRRVHKIFYDALYADPWLGQFFARVPQEIIESQQTDFIARALGGPADYCGRLPIPTHQHMYITFEIFDRRHEMLAEAITEAGVAPDLAKRWLGIDWAFRNKLCKKNLGECKKRYHSDEIEFYPNPALRVRRAG